MKKAGPTDALQPAQIILRIGKAVDVIDPQTIDAPLANEAEYGFVHAIEDLVLLDAQPGKIVDVEEAPVVDVARRDPPMRQPIGLGFEQAVQRPEAFRHPDRAVDERDGALDRLVERIRGRDGAGKLQFQHLGIGRKSAAPFREVSSPMSRSFSLMVRISAGGAVSSKAASARSRMMG